MIFWFDPRIIGLDSEKFTRGGIEWPPYFPDLNPCDYFLWGYVKDKVYANAPKTLDELKNNISTVISKIKVETLHYVIDSFRAHFQLHIITAEGAHFENIIY